MKKNKIKIFFLIFLGIIFIYKIGRLLNIIGIDYRKNGIWNIGIYNFYEDEFTRKIILNPKVHNPVLTSKDVTDRKTKYLADPFLVYKDCNYYMFFEVLTGNGGDIGLAKSTDGINWRYNKIIIDEPFHLSYPMVFTWEGSYYMIPESYEANSIRLYKAVDFPYEWKFVKTLL